MFKSDHAGASASRGRDFVAGFSRDADAFAAAVALSLAAAKPRPFAVFRGDYRRPVRMRSNKHRADARRLAAMQIVADRASSVRKLQRAERIMARVSI